VTKPRRRTVVAAIAAALATGAAGVAFAVVSHADDGVRRVDTTGNFVAPSTTNAADSTTLVSLVPVPSGPTVMTLPAAGGRSTAPVTVAATGGVPTCSTRQVGMSVVTDRPTYRPGDIVVVTAVVKNASAVACNAPLMAADGVCQPQVLLSSPLTSGAPQVRLGPFGGPCSAPALLVPARSTASAVIQAAFQVGAGANIGYLPAGGWKVVLTWPAVAGKVSAQTALRCDLPACGPTVAATTLPTLPPVTTPPITTSTSAPPKP